MLYYYISPFTWILPGIYYYYFFYYFVFSLDFYPSPSLLLRSLFFLFGFFLPMIYLINIYCHFIGQGFLVKKNLIPGIYFLDVFFNKTPKLNHLTDWNWFVFFPGIIFNWWIYNYVQIFYPSIRSYIRNQYVHPISYVHEHLNLVSLNNIIYFQCYLELNLSVSVCVFFNKIKIQQPNRKISVR